MNIIILSQNSLYKEQFEKHDEIETAFLLAELSSDVKEVEAVLLDGEHFKDLNELGKVRELYPDIPVYYKPAELHSDILTKTTTRICSAYKVTVLHEMLTVDQVMEHILSDITDSDDYLSKRVISFFGTHSGAGVSTTVLNLARILSKRVEEKVLVLSLNSWDPADYFYHYQGQYLNDLKVDLKTHNLTPARLLEAVDQHETFYQLAGNRDIKMQRFYQPDEIQHLIDVAKGIFDVILIDGGTHFDTAPTVQSYISSNLRFLVTNQEEKGYRGYFPYVFQQLIEPSGGNSEDFLLVINRYKPSNTLISEKALEDELKMTKVVTLPDMEDLGVLATAQKRLLSDISDTLYSKNLELLSNVIISECQLQEKQMVESQNRGKRGLFSFFK